MACAHAHSLMQTVQAVQHDPGKTENTRRVEALVQAALLLREALAALPALATALAPAQSELLKAVRSPRVQTAVTTTCSSSRCSGDVRAYVLRNAGAVKLWPPQLCRAAGEPEQRAG